MCIRDRNDYVEFLRNKKDMRNSTIGKQIAFLKWFLRWSFKKGYNQNMAYDSFKPKLKNRESLCRCAGEDFPGNRSA